MEIKKLTLQNQLNQEFKVDFFGLSSINPENQNVEFPLIVLSPGGYFTHYSLKEIEPLALAYMNQGYEVAVVYYQLVDGEHPVYPAAALSVIKTLQYFKENAALYSVSANQIVTAGFSAGGHVASAVNAMLLDEGMQQVFALDPANALPAATILGYPFIDIEQLSFELTPEQQKAIPSEVLFHNTAAGVTKQTPPTFVFHAVGDPVVPVSNGISYFNALQANGVVSEAHFFNGKVHGFATAKPRIGESGNAQLVDQHLAHWLRLSTEWLSQVLAAD